jgi:hypothetical protein
VQNKPVRRAQIMAALAEYQGAIDKVRELLTPEHAASTRADEYVRKAHNVDAGKVRKKVRELLTADDSARTAVLASLRGTNDNVIIDDDTMTFVCDGKDKGTDEGIVDGVAFLDNLSWAIEKAKPELRGAFKDKGRSHGARGNTAINLFLYSLAHTIRTAGGNLTTSRTVGTWPKHINGALDILRPFLPKDFPKALPWACESMGIWVNRDLGGATVKCSKKRPD